MPEFTVQDLAITAVAFATVNQLDEKMFMELARAAELRGSELNEQALANTTWAFATVNQLDEKLFTAFAREADQRLTGWFISSFERFLHC